MPNEQGPVTPKKSVIDIMQECYGGDILSKYYIEGLRLTISKLKQEQKPIGNFARIALLAFDETFAELYSKRQFALTLLCVRAANDLLANNDAFADEEFNPAKREYLMHQFYLEYITHPNKPYLGEELFNKHIGPNVLEADNFLYKFALPNCVPNIIEIKIAQIKLGRKKLSAIENELREMAKSPKLVFMQGEKQNRTSVDLIENELAILAIYRDIQALGDYDAALPQKKLFDYIKSQCKKSYPNAEFDAPESQEKLSPDQIQAKIRALAEKNRGKLYENSRLLIALNGIKQFTKDKDETYNSDETSAATLAQNYDPRVASEIAFGLYQKYKELHHGSPEIDVFDERQTQTVLRSPAYNLLFAANHGHMTAQLFLAQFLDPTLPNQQLSGITKNQKQASLFYLLAQENGHLLALRKNGEDRIKAIDPENCSAEDLAFLQTQPIPNSAAAKIALVSEFQDIIGQEDLAGLEQDGIDTLNGQKFMSDWKRYETIMAADANIAFRKILLLTCFYSAYEDDESLPKTARHLRSCLEVMQIAGYEIDPQYKKIPPYYLPYLGNFIAKYSNVLNAEILAILNPLVPAIAQNAEVEEVEEVEEPKKPKEPQFITTEELRGEKKPVEQKGSRIKITNFSPKLTKLHEEETAQNFIDQYLNAAEINFDETDLYFLQSTIEPCETIDNPEHLELKESLLHDLRYLLLRHQYKFPKPTCDANDLILWAATTLQLRPKIFDEHCIMQDKIILEIENLKTRPRATHTDFQIRILERTLHNLILGNAIAAKEKDGQEIGNYFLSIAQNASNSDTLRGVAFLGAKRKFFIDDFHKNSQNGATADSAAADDEKYYRYLSKATKLGCLEAAEEVSYSYITDYINPNINNPHAPIPLPSTIDQVLDFARSPTPAPAAKILAVKLYLNGKLDIENFAPEIFSYVQEIQSSANSTFVWFRATNQIFASLQDIENIDDLKAKRSFVNSLDLAGYCLTHFNVYSLGMSPETLQTSTTSPDSPDVAQSEGIESGQAEDGKVESKSTPQADSSPSQTQDNAPKAQDSSSQKELAKKKVQFANYKSSNPPASTPTANGTGGIPYSKIVTSPSKTTSHN